MKIITFLLFVSICGLVKGQFVIKESECDSLNESNMYNEALLCYKQKEMNETYTIRNIAIIYGQLNNLDSAIKYLDLWFDKGNIDLTLIEMKPFFVFKDAKAWQQYRSKVLNAHKTKNPKFNIAYYDALIEMQNKYIVAFTNIVQENKTNSAYTVKADSLRNQFYIVEKALLVELERLISKNGWPFKNIVGGDVTDIACMLVYDSKDLLKLKKYLPFIMEEIKNENKSIKVKAAEIEDRILVYEGKKQKYGSQHSYDEKTNKWTFYPIEDIENVNKRRHEAGFLETYEEYCIKFKQ